MVERRIRDRKASGSSPCRSSGRIFFSRVNFLCLERLSGYEQSLQNRALRTLKGIEVTWGQQGGPWSLRTDGKGFLGTVVTFEDFHMVWM